MSTADRTAAAARNAITRKSGSSGISMFSTGPTPAGNVARIAAGNTRAVTTTRASPPQPPERRAPSSPRSTGAPHASCWRQSCASALRTRCRGRQGGPARSGQPRGCIRGRARRLRGDRLLEPSQGARETEIGAAAVKAARGAGVEHLIWSTLPDVESLTGGRLKVVHFTGKARVDAIVRSAGFARHTFVEAPFYFQNFLTVMAPQPLPNGGRGWAVPMDLALARHPRR